MGGASDIRAVMRAALGGTLDESQLLAVQGLLYCTGRLSRSICRLRGLSFLNSAPG